MIAAVYARRSTEQNVPDDARSVTRQVELAKAFAADKGWSVIAEYLDDGISGALSTKLAGRAQMVVAAGQGKFSALIVRDLDRLSRSDEELPGLVYALRDAGVDIWCYADRNLVDTRTALNRGMLAMKATFAAAEREAAQQRTREALRRKAQQGHVTGGDLYGYRRVQADGHVIRVPDDAQAEIVRQVFQWTVDGRGGRWIARKLNQDRTAAPSGREWTVTTISRMLRNPAYTGIIRYGMSRYEIRGGVAKRIRLPEDQWITSHRPELQIVSDHLWRQAHATLARTRQLHPGSRGPSASEHLLAGLLRCPCGSTLFASTNRRPHGWLCTRRWKQGSAHCDNRWPVPLEITEVITDQLSREFLTPDLCSGCSKRNSIAGSARNGMPKSKPCGNRWPHSTGKSRDW